MKHFYFLILFFACQIVKAQDNAIFENKWYLSNLIVDGKDNIPPSNNEVQRVLLEFNLAQKSFSTNVCNGGYGENVNFSTEANNFTFDYFIQTLVICDNLENAYFESLYFTFFSNHTFPNIFSYAISDDDGLKTLTITSDPEQAIFTNQQLTNQSFKNSLLCVDPNPARDFIKISFKNSNIIAAKVMLYDSLGKLCFNQSLKNENNAINVQNLKKGLYLLRIETQDSIEIQKIIIQ